MLVKEYVLNDLKKNIVEVKFVKADGSERILKASLQDEYVKPLMEGVSTSTLRQESDNVVTCVDVEINEWRRFKLDSIVDYKILNNNESNIDEI